MSTPIKNATPSQMAALAKLNAERYGKKTEPVRPMPPQPVFPTPPKPAPTPVQPVRPAPPQPTKPTVLPPKSPVVRPAPPQPTKPAVLPVPQKPAPILGKKKLKEGGSVKEKKMSSGGMTSKTSSASSRADGIAQRGKTKGRVV